MLLSLSFIGIVNTSAIYLFTFHQDSQYLGMFWSSSNCGVRDSFRNTVSIFATTGVYHLKVGKLYSLGNGWLFVGKLWSWYYTPRCIVHKLWSCATKHHANCLVATKFGTLQLVSGVATLGHTGARALATRGRAPPVQICIRIIGTDSIVVDRESSAKLSWNRTTDALVSLIHRIASLVRSSYVSLPFKWSTLHYDMASEPTCNALKFKKIFWGACLQKFVQT